MTRPKAQARDNAPDSIFRVTLTYGVTPWLANATTSLTVKNETTDAEEDTYTLQANASSTEGIWLLDVQVMATSTIGADAIPGVDQTSDEDNP